MARILLLTHIYPPAIDGGSRVISKIGKYLSKQNHQILIVTSDCRSTDDFTRRHSLIFHAQPHILRLPVYTFLHRPLKLMSTTLSKGPIFKLISFLKALRSIICFSPDLIIAGPLPTTIILYANLIRFITKALTHQSTKLLINASFHPTDPDFNKPSLLKVLKSADYIWTLTKYETDYFQNQLNIPKQKLLLLGNGVDNNFLQKKAKKISLKTTNLLFVGSFAAHKGLDTLINAFALLPPSITLTLAGQPTLYFPAIKKQINSLPAGIKKRIKIIQSFPSAHLSRLIDISSILILPSRQESFGLVLIEALARKTPIITADIPQLFELISKTNGGLTFKRNSPGDLAKQIQKLISQPQLSKTLGQNGFNYVSKHYTWDKIGKDLCQKLSL
ncbi:MAG: glycosyltransferase family 4 protein [Patescibacteria group bacterium]